MKTINLIILLCVVLVSGCAKKVTTGDGGGVAAFDGSLRVLSYNIHHANPPSRKGEIDLDSVAAVINRQAPHLVALQEVDVYTNRSGRTLHQAEELGRRTGMQTYFARAIDFDGGQYGLAILSRFPLQDVQGTPLPTVASTKGEPRILMTAQVNLPGGRKIRFAATHLDALKTDTNRVLQVGRILELLEGDSLPVVLAGDFNDVPGSRAIGLLDTHFTRTCTISCGFTFPETHPMQTIDFIAYKPSGAFTVQEHAVVEEIYASDHRPVQAVLKLK